MVRGCSNDALRPAAGASQRFESDARTLGAARIPPALERRGGNDDVDHRHSLVGTFFYGVFAAKVLIVRDHSLPRWALPTAGLTLASMLVALWVTSSLWYFTTVRFGF